MAKDTSSQKAAKYLRPEVLTKINRLELRARAVVEGFISGLHKSPYHGFSVEFAEHREYVPGDDIRHIDWRVYSRVDRFYVKQYEEETNLRAHLLLDCSHSMAYPESPEPGRMTKWEYASTVAASLAYFMMLQQDAAGMMLFDHRVRDQIPPTSNRSQIHGMIDLIDRTKPSEKTETKTLFQHLADRIRRRGMVIIISDLLTDLDDLLPGLSRLAYTGHEVIVMHVLDHDEVEFPFTNNTLFEGLEDVDVELLADPQSLRKSYLAALDAFVSQVRSACLNHGMDYTLMNTRDSLGVALGKFLAKRMHQTSF
jgi:uncharacterized protein (DUF58 family)